MTRHANTSQPPRSMLRPAPLVLGLALATAGVALNEAGVDAGRPLLVVGLAIAVLGAALLLWPRPAPVPQQAPAPQRPDRWPEVAELAQRLNLQLDERSASGEHSGRGVLLELDRGAEQALVRVSLIRQLDMGLTVAPGQVGGDARQKMLSGDERFDDAYTVRADEVKRAHGVVTERLRGHLLEDRVHINDEYVQVFAEPERSALAHALRTAMKAAAELERASVHVPCARPMRDSVEVWLDFAGEHKLATASTPLSMWGELNGVNVLAIAVRDAFENFHFEISATFPEPLGRGLALRPASAATALDRSGEPLGLPAFDKVFVVKSTDPADTVRLVTPEVRRTLIRLRDRGLQLRADDTKMWAWVGLNRAAPELVPETLLELSVLASMVRQNAAEPPGGAISR